MSDTSIGTSSAQLTPGRWSTHENTQLDFYDSERRYHVGSKGFPLTEIRAEYEDGGETHNDLVAVVVMEQDGVLLSAAREIYSLLSEYHDEMGRAMGILDEHNNGDDIDMSESIDCAGAMCSLRHKYRDLVLRMERDLP